MVLYLDRMSQCGLHAVPWSHIGILMSLLAAEPRSTAGLFFPISVPLERSCRLRIRWCGTGGFQEQCQCFFIGLSCSIHIIVFWYFSPFLVSVYMLVLWGWGLRTDRVYITLSLPCCRPLSIIIIIIIINRCFYTSSTADDGVVVYSVPLHHLNNYMTMVQRFNRCQGYPRTMYSLPDMNKRYIPSFVKA